MGFRGDLKNCRVLIKDVDGKRLLADTRITDYDIYKNIAKIRPSSLTVKAEEVKNGPISALVFCDNGLYEYSGSLRIVLIANEVEIKLFSGKQKESRKHLRYDIKLPGNVQALIIENQRILLRKPIEITSKNISKTGVLIQAMTGSFEPGDCLQLSLRLKDMEISGDYKVVRKQNGNLWTEEYGCRRVADGKKE